jgi:hypothetical protein
LTHAIGEAPRDTTYSGPPPTSLRQRSVDLVLPADSLELTAHSPKEREIDFYEASRVFGQPAYMQHENLVLDPEQLSNHVEPQRGIDPQRTQYYPDTLYWDGSQPREQPLSAYPHTTDTEYSDTPGQTRVTHTDESQLFGYPDIAIAAPPHLPAHDGDTLIQFEDSNSREDHFSQEWKALRLEEDMRSARRPKPKLTAREELREMAREIFKLVTSSPPSLP